MANSPKSATDSAATVAASWSESEVEPPEPQPEDEPFEYAASERFQSLDGEWRFPYPEPADDACWRVTAERLPDLVGKPVFTSDRLYGGDEADVGATAARDAAQLPRAARLDQAHRRLRHVLGPSSRTSLCRQQSATGQLTAPSVQLGQIPPGGNWAWILDRYSW